MRKDCACFRTDRLAGSDCTVAAHFGTGVAPLGLVDAACKPAKLPKSDHWFSVSYSQPQGLGKELVLTLKRRCQMSATGSRILSTPEMAGVYAKVNRASDALSSLESDVVEHCEIERRQQVMEIRQGAPLAKGSDEPPVLHDFSARTGEIAYNLRSALDHLVWQLVLVNNETPGRRNEFPIFQKEDEYQAVAKRKLRGLADRYQELIEGFQPYRENGRVGTHLWMLHSICNIDKHRHLNVVNVHSSVTASLEGEVEPGLLPPGMTGGLHLWDLLASTRHKDQVKIDVKVGVCFRDNDLEAASPGYGSALEREGMKRPPVIQVLQSSLDAVVAVIEQLTGESVGLGGS